MYFLLISFHSNNLSTLYLLKIYNCKQPLLFQH